MEKDSFITKQKRQNTQIEFLITQCDSSLEKLRIVEIKRKLCLEFIKLRNCKTDLQKVTQLERIKVFMKQVVKMLIQENFKYKDIIASSKIINQGLGKKEGEINKAYNQLFEEFNGYDVSTLDSDIATSKEEHNELNSRLKERQIEKNDLLNEVKKKKFYRELMLMRMEFNGLTKHRQVLNNKKKLLQNIM